MNLDILMKIAYAWGIGILIGLERSLDYKRLLEASQEESYPEAKEKSKEEIIGIRTYSLLALLGFAAAMLHQQYTALAPVIMIGAILLILALYWRTGIHDLGITTEVAALLTVGLGAVSFFQPHISGVLALLVTVVLASKRFARKTVAQIRMVELTDTLKFLVIILILLPIFPNKALDPYQAFNPYKVTFLIILISGISFVGYFLTKFLGAQRGMGLTGLLGGLASSTAVTAAMANQVKANPSLRGSCGFATVIANTTMFIRVLVVVAVLDLTLAKHLAWSIGAMSLVALLSVIVLWLWSGKSATQAEGKGDVSLSNPFSIGPALKFAFFFVAILFAAKIAKLYMGDAGIYLTSLISGLADVDPITLSIAEQTKQGHLAYSVAAIGINIAVIANSVVKSLIALYSGGWRFGLLVGSILMSAAAVGLIVLLIRQ